MAAKFGTLIERLVGAEVFFAPDGELIGTADAAIGNAMKPVVTAPDTIETVYADYSLGRVNSAKGDPKTKDRVREWAATTGGYKSRTDKVVIEDAFIFTLIDFAPQLIDQLQFGTAELASAGAQQAFEKSTRYVDGWLLMIRKNESGTAIGTIEIHARISLDVAIEDKNDPISPSLRAVHLADAGALDTITFAVG